MTGQNAVMLAALKQGPRTSAELSAMGVGRPNSRAADLNQRGHRVECRFNPAADGAARYVYHLVELLDEAGTAAVVSGGTPAEPVSSSSPPARLATDKPGLAGPGAAGPSFPAPVMGCSPRLGGSTGDRTREGRVQGAHPARPVVSPADGRVEPEAPAGQPSVAPRQLSLIESAA